MITRLREDKGRVCEQIESKYHEDSQPYEVSGEKPLCQKIQQIRRQDVFPAKLLTSREDVDSYLEGIREKLYESLEANGGIEIH